jgi:hypothetical protein
MGMKATTIRFSEDLWEMLEREAATQEISTAQLIRDAAILRVSALAGRRGDQQLEVSVEELAERASRRRAASSENGDLEDPDRLAAVRATGLLDGDGDPDLDKIAHLARTMLNADAALITLIDSDRQVFVSSPGLEEPWSSRGETTLDYSFCKHPAIDCDPLVIVDARKDPVLRDHPAVEHIGVVAYLGVPLITSEGHGIGTFCVICEQPRIWTDDQVDVLKTLARAILDHLRVKTAVS